ncbi:MAG: hypothetical protein MNPFHGCM_00301 [Gemmatimonadaceae bacterium]|nr:hypothetical protein [Gemmatimonadaceae bacterium]
MPALVNNALAEGPLVAGYRLASDETPPSQRVLTPAYYEWCARRSPIEVRGIRVTFVLSGTCLRPAVQRAVHGAARRMDWQGIRAMVDAVR